MRGKRLLSAFSFPHSVWVESTDGPTSDAAAPRRPNAVRMANEIAENVAMVPEPYPRSGSFVIIYGQPGAGKTNLLNELFIFPDSVYNKQFDEIVLFTPSLHSILSPDESVTFLNLPPERIHVDLDKFAEVIQSYEATDLNVCFIIDDCMDQISHNGLHAKEVFSASFRRRHLVTSGEGPGLTLFITTQLLRGIAARTRKNASHLIVFPFDNEEEFDALQESVARFSRLQLIELVSFLNKRNREWDSADPATRPGYKPFLFFNLNKGLVFLNFDKQLHVPDAAVLHELHFDRRLSIRAAIREGRIKPAPPQ